MSYMNNLHENCIKSVNKMQLMDHLSYQINEKYGKDQIPATSKFVIMKNVRIINSRRLRKQ